MIVILSPSAPGVDPSLELEPPPALRGPAVAVSPGGAHVPDASEVFEAWELASRRFAIWPGEVFDSRFPNRPLHEVVVNFLASDDLLALTHTKCQQLVEYHRQYLSVAFPLTHRLVAVNFNAAGAWHSGVQMAALALSSGTSADGVGDSTTLVHAGRFAQDNGGCGYVLKPEHLRPQEGDAAADAAAPMPQRLELRTLAARAVPGVGAERGATALAVSVWGAPEDCARQVYRPVKVEGPVISWPEAAPTAPGVAPKPMTFVIGTPVTAILAFELLEVDPHNGAVRCAGRFAAPVQGLRPGLRWVPIWAPDGGGEARPSRHGALTGLLVHLAIAREARRPTRRSAQRESQ